MMIRIWLPDERPVSLNTFMRWSWPNQHRAAQDKKLLIDACLRDTISPNPDDWPRFDTPVVITMTVWFASRPQDASNLTLKLYEDGLIGTILTDDAPPFVDEVRLKSRLASKGQPAGVLIEVETA